MQEQDNPEQVRLQAERTAYVRRDYDPGRDGQPVRPAPPAVGPEHERPPTALPIILAIINVIGFGFGVSLVLGIVALVLTVSASRDTSVTAARQRLGQVKVINIVGLAFLALQLVVIILIVLGVIALVGGLFTGPGLYGDFPLG
jgi:hypothetical protein